MSPTVQQGGLFTSRLEVAGPGLSDQGGLMSVFRLSSRRAGMPATLARMGRLGDDLMKGEPTLQMGTPGRGFEVNSYSCRVAFSFQSEELPPLRRTTGQ
jgi:hypothetical protein